MGKEGLMSGISRRKVLIGAGALAATAAAAPILAACQPSKTAGSGKVVVMTDPNEFNDDDRKTLETATKLKIEVVASNLTTLYAMFAAGNPPDVFRVQAAGVPQYISRKMLKDLQPYFANSKLLKIDDLAPANNFYKWDGKQVGKGDLYGMVKDWSPDFTLYAYTKAFDEASVKIPSDTTPLTYDELRDLARKVNKKSAGKRVYWGFVHSNNDQWIDRTAMNMLAEKNQSLYTDDFSKLVIAANPESNKDSDRLGHLVSNERCRRGVVGVRAVHGGQAGAGPREERLGRPRTEVAVLADASTVRFPEAGAAGASR